MKVSTIFLAVTAILFFSCAEQSTNTENNTMKLITAQDILGSKEYRAISYGGYRDTSRAIQPTLGEIKQDMLLLHAAGIRVLRTYNTKLKHAHTLLEAIHNIKQSDPSFEMYVMLGAWIDCKGAWTDHRDHYAEDEEANAAEIERAVAMANQYPDIVKIIAVGNEAMVKWAEIYYVQPGIILKWVNYLQKLKEEKKLSQDLWITSSDNFASWGGGGTEYHVPDLELLFKAVDFVSLHTYPMHDTHYNPQFWGVRNDELEGSKEEQINESMNRAVEYSQLQYDSVVHYMKRIGVDKPVHIGETGWASSSNGHYGSDGSKATDEYKEGLYHTKIRLWSEERGITCFYFEAFDEPWKDAGNPSGSENYFGLFTVEGQAKYPIWDLVDNGVFEGLTRGNGPITKTYDGQLDRLLETVEIPPVKAELQIAY